MNMTTRKAILIMLAIVLVVGVGGFLLVKMLVLGNDTDTMGHQDAGGMVMDTPMPEAEMETMEQLDDTMVMETPVPEEKAAGAKPAPIRFSSMGTVHGGEMQYGIFTPDTYLWDFGDGITSTEPNPTHQYEAPGTYTVSLTVTSTDGREFTDITEIIVEAPE